MFPIATLLTLAAYVAADQTFSLTAVGNSVNFPVQLDNDRLVLNTGSAATFNLEEPAGYISASGGSSDNYLTSTPQYGLVLRSKGEASSAWGYIDGHLRLNAGNVNSFYACPLSDDTYYINGSPCLEGGEEVSLNLDGSSDNTSTTSEASSSTTSEDSSTTPEASSSTESITETSSEAEPTTSTPVGYNSTTTEEHTSSTLVTITSCSDDACTSSVAPSVTPVNAGAQAKVAAGAFAAAAALLL